MGNLEAPQAPSIWFGEADIDDLARFDRQFKRRSEGTYSRSEEIKHAMRIHLLIDEVLEDNAFNPASPKERESLVRQALYDYFRAEDST